MDKWVMQRKRNLQVSLMAVLHSRTKDFPLPVKVIYYNMTTPACDLKAGTLCLLLIKFHLCQHTGRRAFPERARTWHLFEGHEGP